MPLMLISPPSIPPPPGGEWEWARVSEDGTAITDHGNAVLALLPTGDEFTLVMPTSAISWHNLTLPPGSLGNPTRLRSVLEGLLEERLLDDAENLHLAIAANAKPGEPTWVAVCDRAALRTTLQMLESAGHRVMRIVPEYAPQPENAPTRMYATGEPNAAFLTVCDANGVVTLPWGAPSLALALNTPLDKVRAKTEPAVAALAEALLRRSVPIVQRPERWLRAARGRWDLAQFEFSSSGRARAGKQITAIAQMLRHAPQWRAARWGLIVLVLAQIVGLNALAWKERNALEAQRAMINGILTQTFPSVKLVVDAPKQMANEVATLQQATGGVVATDFEPMLAALANGLPAGRLPTAIDYTSGQMRLRGLALSPDEVSQLSSALSPQGYSARAEGDLTLVQAESPR